MTLLEIVRDLDLHDNESTIYVAEPWTKDSQAIVAPEPDIGGVPQIAEASGLKYFIEVFVAREFLEGLNGSLKTKPSIDQQCERLIQYAINDA